MPIGFEGTSSLLLGDKGRRLIHVIARSGPEYYAYANIGTQTDN